MTEGRGKQPGNANDRNRSESESKQAHLKMKWIGHEL